MVEATLMGFGVLVAEMRRKQGLYFSHRTQFQLKLAKEAEARVDQALVDLGLQLGTPDLFNLQEHRNGQTAPGQPGTGSAHEGA